VLGKQRREFTRQDYHLEGLSVSPYVQSIRICFKCDRTDHISKYCKKPEVCLNCAGDHRSSREAPCGLEKKCINCSGPHNTTDCNCPVLKKHMEITRIWLLITFLFLRRDTHGEEHQFVENGSS